MAYYKISDPSVIQKTKDIVASTFAWYDALTHLANQYGFDRVVLKGRNEFHQYAVNEFAVHESRQALVDSEMFEMIGRLTISHNSEHAMDRGVYLLYHPKDKAMRQELVAKIERIGIFSPKRQLLETWCASPDSIVCAYLTNLDSVIEYETDRPIANNHQFCELISEIEFLDEYKGSDLVTKDSSFYLFDTTKLS